MKPDDVVKAAGEQAVTMLGVVDIAMGGIATYLIWLHMLDVPELVSVVRSTGNPVLDVALLVVLSGLLGKAAHLVAAFPVAIIFGLVVGQLRKAPGCIYEKLGAELERLGIDVDELKLNVVDAAMLVVDEAAAPAAGSFQKRVDGVVVVVFFGLVAVYFAFAELDAWGYRSALIGFAIALLLYSAMTLKDIAGSALLRLKLKSEYDTPVERRGQPPG